MRRTVCQRRLSFLFCRLDALPVAQQTMSVKVLKAYLTRMAPSRAHISYIAHDRGLSQLLHTELHWLDVPERAKYKLNVMVHRCLNGCAPQYLSTYVFRSLQLPPGSICVLLFVISWRYTVSPPQHVWSSGFRNCRPRRRGTHCQHTFVVRRTAPLHLHDYLRLICFLSTSVYSALGRSAIMRYINRRFTYLLNLLLLDKFLVTHPPMRSMGDWACPHLTLQ